MPLWRKGRWIALCKTHRMTLGYDKVEKGNLFFPKTFFITVLLVPVLPLYSLFSPSLLSPVPKWLARLQRYDQKKDGHLVFTTLTTKGSPLRPQKRTYKLTTGRDFMHCTWLSIFHMFPFCSRPTISCYPLLTFECSLAIEKFISDANALFKLN